MTLSVMKIIARVKCAIKMLRNHAILVKYLRLQIKMLYSNCPFRKNYLSDLLDSVIGWEE